MKFMSEWCVRPSVFRDAVARFLETQAAPPAGVKLLGRWHKADLTGGYSLYESDDPKAIYESAAEWTDLCEIRSSVVVEDADAGPVLAKLFK